MCTLGDSHRTSLIGNHSMPWIGFESNKPPATSRMHAPGSGPDESLRVLFLCALILDKEYALLAFWKIARLFLPGSIAAPSTEGNALSFGNRVPFRESNLRQPFNLHSSSSNLLWHLSALIQFPQCLFQRYLSRSCHDYVYLHVSPLFPGRPLASSSQTLSPGEKHLPRNSPAPGFIKIPFAFAPPTGPRKLQRSMASLVGIA